LLAKERAGVAEMGWVASAGDEDDDDHLKMAPFMRKCRTAAVTAQKGCFRRSRQRRETGSVDEESSRRVK